MKILQICVGTPKDVEFNGKRIRTSIFKSPVNGKVAVRRQNIDGDKQSDLTVHGGRDKAVYVYTFENYEYYKKVLGVEYFPYGQFGENFTVEGMSDDAIHIGDVFRIGEALVEVTHRRYESDRLINPGAYLSIYGNRFYDFHKWGYLLYFFGR